MLNLYGETIYSIDDVCDIVDKRAMINGVFQMKYNLNSEKQGFWLSPHPEFSTHDTPGLYSIFKDNCLVYIGQAGSIGGRLSRFVKVVLGHERSDEDFPAAKKWIRWYGRDLTGCYVMFSEYYDFDEEEYGYSRLTIEEHLIMRHKPRFNVK